MNITTSASCSMAPDSRKSESCGPRSSRSGARVSWLSTSTGICSSFARPFNPREMLDTSSWRFPKRPPPVMSLRYTQPRFPLRWTRRQNQQLGRLQAGRELIHFRIARGDSRDALAFTEDFFQAFKIVADDVLYGNQPRAHAVFRQCKNRRFRVIQNGVGAVLALALALLNFVLGVNQPPQDPLFLDDARVVLDVRH